jgi:hypothetical protein
VTDIAQTERRPAPRISFVSVVCPKALVPVKPARFGVPLDPLIEATSLESLEPGPEFGELIGRQFRQGLFELFE